MSDSVYRFISCPHFQTLEPSDGIWLNLVWCYAIGIHKIVIIFDNIFKVLINNKSYPSGIRSHDHLVLIRKAILTLLDAVHKFNGCNQT